MKNILIFLVSLLLFNTEINAQNDTINNSKPKKNYPKTDINVKKEYDEHGNLIRYDSSYSYYYSNINNDTILNDSILSEFKNHFNKRHLFFEDQFFKDYFFQDSLFDLNLQMKDFIKEFRNKRYQMDDFFREMDSIRNHFLIKPILKSPDKKEIVL